MPELPEVETVRLELDRVLKNRRISEAVIHDPRVLQGFLPGGGPRRAVDPVVFNGAVAGRVVKAVSRRGKYLIFDLGAPRYMLCHLRMTGRLLWGPPRPVARAELRFQGAGEVLSFEDARRFGEWTVGDDPARDPALSALGPEPLSADWNVDAWARALRASKARVHAALLDQRRLAGIGNIYALEALFTAGVRPTRRSDRLSHGEALAIAEGLKTALKAGLARRGVTFNSYRDPAGRRGLAQKYLLVYGRDGEPCKRCGEALKSVRVCGRGGVFCGRCQK